MSCNGSQLYAGLMSGTSLDGVDATLVDFNAPLAGQKIRHFYQRYSAGLKEELLGLCSAGADEIARSQRVAAELSKCYATAINALLEQEKIHPGEVAAIGCHGQTVRHAPDHHWTLQLVNPHVLAEQTGIAVAYDFRGRDMACGGQGAPLAPIFHALLFRRDGKATAVVNIGGISNLTILPPRESHESPRAHDVGPGGVLMDSWSMAHRNKAYDENGQWAAQGKVDADLLKRMLGEPYFQKAPPKSTGRELFNAAWLEKFAVSERNPADVQATLLELTAKSIEADVAQESLPDRIVLCGGGALNAALVARLRELLKAAEVIPCSKLGFPESWIEPAAFAYLAKCRVEKISIETSGLTGSNPGGHLPGALVCATKGKATSRGQKRSRNRKWK